MSGTLVQFSISKDVSQTSPISKLERARSLVYGSHGGTYSGVRAFKPLPVLFIFIAWCSREKREGQGRSGFWRMGGDATAEQEAMRCLS